MGACYRFGRLVGGDLARPQTAGLLKAASSASPERFKLLNSAVYGRVAPQRCCLGRVVRRHGIYVQAMNDICKTPGPCRLFWGGKQEGQAVAGSGKFAYCIRDATDLGGSWALASVS